MSKSINQSFSYGIEQAATVAEAEDLARKEGKSFSKYILGLIKEDLERKKAEAPDKLPIGVTLENGHINNRQSLIKEFISKDPKEIVKAVCDLGADAHVRFTKLMIYSKKSGRFY